MIKPENEYTREMVVMIDCTTIDVLSVHFWRFWEKAKSGRENVKAFASCRVLTI
jgi:hypothetical protein